MSDGCSTASFEFYDQVPHGVIFQKDMVRTQRAIIDSGVGRLLESGQADGRNRVPF